MAIQFRALFLMAVVLLPLVLVSVNSMEAELDIELLESLTEEENDEKDSEDAVYFFSVNFSLEANIQPVDEENKCLNNIAEEVVQRDLTNKVPTPPPELS